MQYIGIMSPILMMFARGDTDRMREVKELSESRESKKIKGERDRERRLARASD